VLESRRVRVLDSRTPGSEAAASARDATAARVARRPHYGWSPMKKPTTKQLALRTQTIATLTAQDLRAAAGGSLSPNIGFTSQLNNGFTSQLSNAGWSFTII
jgi:hypothetical protein